MSYWIYLRNDAVSVCQVDPQQEGGTVEQTGTTDAAMNVTYNYRNLFDFRSLHGKSGHETVPVLEEAIAELGTDRDPDYWRTTPGNVGHVCSIFLEWAQKYPDAMWHVS